MMMRHLFVIALLLGTEAQSQVTPRRAVNPTLARADSAYSSGDFRRARTLYVQVLASDSTSSRAVFRLAQLDDSDERALSLYRRYIALEPNDAWGHMAEGDQLARMGRWEEGLVAYDGAGAVAPGERDVTLGRARVFERAGRPHLAAEELAAWTTGHPNDGEAWDLLGRAHLRSGRPKAAASALQRAAALGVHGAQHRLQRAKSTAAPAIAAEATSNGDSDGTRLLRAGTSVDVMPVDGMRLGARAHSLSVANQTEELRGIGFEGTGSSVLTPGIRLNATMGFASYGLESGPGRRAESWVTPHLTTRLRARAPAGGPAVDIRMERAPMALNPQLVQNRVSRTEARVQVEVPVSVFRARASGRLATITSANEPANRRAGVEGALLLPLGSALQPSVQYRVAGYERPSAAGYFTPRRAETIDAGLYLESGADGAVSLAADVGGGLQRVAEHGTSTGSWGRALRAWGEANVSLGPSRAWYVELEAYDAPFALEGAGATGSWRFLSLSSGLRWAIR